MNLKKGIENRHRGGASLGNLFTVYCPHIPEVLLTVYYEDLEDPFLLWTLRQSESHHEVRPGEKMPRSMTIYQLQFALQSQPNR